jgi:hypothetical protein
MTSKADVPLHIPTEYLNRQHPETASKSSDYLQHNTEHQENGGQSASHLASFLSSHISEFYVKVN